MSKIALLISLFLGVIFSQGLDTVSPSSNQSDDSLVVEIPKCCSSEDALLKELKASRIEVKQLLQKNKTGDKKLAELWKKLTSVVILSKLGSAPYIKRSDPLMPYTDIEKEKIKDALYKMPMITEVRELFIDQVDSQEPFIYHVTKGEFFEYQAFRGGQWLANVYLDLDVEEAYGSWAYHPVITSFGQTYQLILPWPCTNPSIKRLLIADTIETPVPVPSEPEIIYKDSVIYRDTCIPPPPEIETPSESGWWPELWLWTGHYEPVPRPSGGRGEFAGGKGTIYFGNQFAIGIGGLANWWNWRSRDTRSQGFEGAIGPAFSFFGEQSRFTAFVYYDAKLNWYHNPVDDYWAKQMSQLVFPGLTFDLWSSDYTRWLEFWADAKFDFNKVKRSTVDGQGLTIDQDPANDKGQVFVGARVFLLPEFAGMHLGLSFKSNNSFEDRRWEAMPGLVLDINYLAKLSVEWKQTSFSTWEKENGGCLGVILDIDPIGIVLWLNGRGHKPQERFYYEK